MWWSFKKQLGNSIKDLFCSSKKYNGGWEWEREAKKATQKALIDLNEN